MSHSSESDLSKVLQSGINIPIDIYLYINLDIRKTGLECSGRWPRSLRPHKTRFWKYPNIILFFFFFERDMNASCFLIGCWTASKGSFQFDSFFFFRADIPGDQCSDRGECRGGFPEVRSHHPQQDRVRYAES